MCPRGRKSSPHLRLHLSLSTSHLSTRLTHSRTFLGFRMSNILLSSDEMVKLLNRTQTPSVIFYLFLCQTQFGLDSGQVKVLKQCFDGFSDKEGAISTDTVGSILSMMAWKV